MPQSVRMPALASRGEVATRAVNLDTIVAASQAYTPSEWRNAQVFGGNNPWENEAWGFYDTLGEFAQAVDWQARAMSRVRLGAAEIIPGADEPEMITEGPAAEFMAAFCGGPPGHSAFLKAITPQLEVPGQGWLIAERNDPTEPLALADWGVYSMDCVQGLGATFQVRVGPGAWRYLAPDNLPMRIYNPHPRWPWLATSSAQAALPIMRRIHLIDSRIVAMMVSRLAMNGLMLIPDEGSISVPPPFKEAPDGFVRYLIDIASKNIANPGQASAGIPIPIKFTADLIEKWKILKPEDPLDEWLLKERTDELGRLGDTLGIARERVTGGMGQQNHWNAWQVSEEEVRLCFAPTCEVICGAVTKAYLQPMLAAAGVSGIGPHGGRLIAWYDVSNLAARPDNAENARQNYHDGVISEAALRRETGFGDGDALDTPEEIETWAYKRWIAAGVAELAPTALTGLVPNATVPAPAPAVGGGPAPAASGTPAQPEQAAPAAGPPPTRTAPPPSPTATPPPATVAAARLRELAETKATKLNGHGRDLVISRR